MIPTSFRTRAVSFAYLFGPPRVLTRPEGLAVYDAVCNALGVDDLTFQYGSAPAGGEGAGPPAGSGFLIQMQRQVGRGSLASRIDNQNLQNPIRFLITWTWPPSREHVAQDFDAAVEAAFNALGGTWHRVLAETRLHGQIEAQGGSALGFLLSRALRVDPERLDGLEAAPNFASIVLETPPGDPSVEDALHQPKREIKLEVLREDGRSLYVELMSQWPQLAATQQGTMELDARRIRRFDDPPSVYIRNSQDFLMERVVPLFASTSV
jgi:hypothetical protein